MTTDLPDVTPAEIEAAIDLLCSRGWSPPNAHGFATDIRDAIIAARRRAPPIAAPAPSAMATGEDERTALRDIIEDGSKRGLPYDEIARFIYDLGFRRATPPAAPAAVTVTDAMVEAALRAETLTLQQIDRENREVGKPYADGSDDRERMRAAIAAALAAGGASDAQQGA